MTNKSNIITSQDHSGKKLVQHQFKSVQPHQLIGVGPPKAALTNFQLFKTKYSDTPQRIIKYSKCRVLKLEDMIKMEKAKFMFKYNNKMLAICFDNYFLKLEKVHKYNTRQKIRNEYFQIYSRTKSGRKALHHLCLKLWKEIPLEFRCCTFYRSKNYYKSTI